MKIICRPVLPGASASPTSAASIASSAGVCRVAGMNALASAPGVGYLRLISARSALVVSARSDCTCWSFPISPCSSASELLESIAEESTDIALPDLHLDGRLLAGQVTHLAYQQPGLTHHLLVARERAFHG